MRLLTGFTALLGLISGFQGLSAQGGPSNGDHLYAFLRHPVSDGAEYALCIRENDRSCLRASPEEILEVFQVDHPDLKLLTAYDDLPRYIESLVKTRCPQEDVRMSGIEIPSRRINPDWHRMLRPDEMCLADNNRGILIASLFCGNPFTNRTSSHAAIPYKPEATIAMTPRSALLLPSVPAADAIEKPVRKPVVNMSVNKSQGGGFWHSKWPYLIGGVIAGGVGGYFIGANTNYHIHNSNTVTTGIGH